MLRLCLKRLKSHFPKVSGSLLFLPKAWKCKIIQYKSPFWCWFLTIYTKVTAGISFSRCSRRCFLKTLFTLNMFCYFSMSQTTRTLLTCTDQYIKTYINYISIYRFISIFTFAINSPPQKICMFFYLDDGNTDTLTFSSSSLAFFSREGWEFESFQEKQQNIIQHRYR